MNLLVSSDEELISLFQSGNNEAFAILLHRYADQIKYSNYINEYILICYKSVS